MKLIGALAFNAGTVVFPHLEIVATALVSVASESETPVALHAGRVIETIAGCIANSGTDDANGQTFWNIVFDPVIKLAQNSQITLREVACDCLGSIGSNMLSLLPVSRNSIFPTSQAPTTFQTLNRFPILYSVERTQHYSNNDIIRSCSRRRKRGESCGSQGVRDAGRTFVLGRRRRIPYGPR